VVAEAIDDREGADLAEARDHAGVRGDGLEVVEIAPEGGLVLDEGDQRDRGRGDARFRRELAEIRDEVAAPLLGVARIGHATFAALARDLELEPKGVLGRQLPEWNVTTGNLSVTTPSSFWRVRNKIAPWIRCDVISVTTTMPAFDVRSR
jgi:hypothetical protein